MLFCYVWKWNIKVTMVLHHKDLSIQPISQKQQHSLLQGQDNKGSCVYCLEITVVIYNFSALLFSIIYCITASGQTIITGLNMVVQFNSSLPITQFSQILYT